MRIQTPYNQRFTTPYSFQDMEHDDELKGDGNSYTTQFRQYDPRLGRWLSIDPLSAKFPWQSPYAAFDNNPICLNDPKGAASEVANGDGNKKLTQNNNGTRSASNGDGTTTYDAPGFSQVTIPDRAIILGTVQDGNGNGKLDDGKGNQLQASKGDLNSFKIDNVVYTAKFSKGKFMGFSNSSNEKYAEASAGSSANGQTLMFNAAGQNKIDMKNFYSSTAAATNEVENVLIDTPVGDRLSTSAYTSVSTSIHSGKNSLVSFDASTEISTGDKTLSASVGPFTYSAGMNDGSSGISLNVGANSIGYDLSISRGHTFSISSTCNNGVTNGSKVSFRPGLVSAAAGGVIVAVDLLSGGQATWLLPIFAP